MATHRNHHRKNIFYRLRKWLGIGSGSGRGRTRRHPTGTGDPGVSQRPAEGLQVPPISQPGVASPGNSRKRRPSHHAGNWKSRLRHFFRKITGKSTRKTSHKRHGTITAPDSGLSPADTFTRLQQGLPVSEVKKHRHRSLRGRITSLLHRINPFRRKSAVHHRRLKPGDRGHTLRQQQHRHRRKFWFFGRKKHKHTPPISAGKTEKQKVTLPAALAWTRNELPGYLLRLAGSMSLFMAAYVITWFIYSLAVIFTASFFNIHAVLTYFEVMWTIDNSSPLWSDLNIVAITFSGPFVSLIMGFIYYVILKKRKQMGSHWRTLFFWLFVLSMAHFLGAFVAGAITWQGFGYVIGWVYMHIFFRILISLIFLAAMAWIGWLHAGFMLETRTLRFRPSDIPYLLINRMILPYVLGTILLCIIKLPNAAPQHPTIWDYDVMILASVLFAVAPPLFNKKLKPPSRLPKKTTHRRRRIIAYSAIAASVALVLLYRIGLSDGLYVFMKFVVNVTWYK